MMVRDTASNWMYGLTDRLARLESPLAKYLAAPALVLLALSTFSGQGGGNTALFLLLVGLVLMVPVHARALIRDSLFLATVAFLVWILVVSLDPGMTRAEDIAWVRNKAAEWARVLMLPALLVGFWLARVPRLLPWLPLLMVVGYTIKVVSMTTPELLELFMSGRSRAGYDNDITRFGIYSAISLFAATASIWTVRGLQRRVLRIALYAVVACCAAVAMAGLVFSQTRAAWLATAVVIVLCVALGLRAARAGTIQWRTVFGTTAVVGLVLAVSSAVFHDLIADRLLDHVGTITQLLSGQGWDNPPLDPVGYRISAYWHGLLTWLESPWLGHGPGIDYFAFRGQSDPALDYVIHFHNMYINVLATWGVFGLVLFVGVLGVLAARARRAFVAGTMPTHIGIFLVASALSLLIFGLFDQILLDERLPFLLGVLGGIATGARQSGCWYAMRSSAGADQYYAGNAEFRSHERPEPAAEPIS